uniref:Endonuclease/exonuclease/phosphatase domain-containing protein n=1 Tax=Trichogramma kaykai TaxID=54128 RepID=A0ABD2WN72_9HYME
MSQTVRELGINVAIVCDQYKNPGSHYTWIADSNTQAAIWVLGGLRVQGRPSRAHPFFTWVRVSDVYIFSVYAPPRLSTAEFSALLVNVGEEAQGKRPLIIAGDFNGYSTEWGSSETKPRGAILLDVLSALDVVLLNTGRTPTFTGSQGSSIMSPSNGGRRKSPLSAGSVCEKEDSLKERGDGPWRTLASPILPSPEADCALPSRTASAAAGVPSATRSTGTCGAAHTERSWCI